MLRLAEVVLFTRHMGRKRAFYEQQLGLDPHTLDPRWTAFRTRGAILALRAAPEGRSPHAELTFATDDLDAFANHLRRQGVAAVAVRAQSWGKILHLRDPEDNAVAVIQPSVEIPGGDGPELEGVTVRVRSLEPMKSFYRDVLGLSVASQSRRSTRLEAGDVALTLQTRGRGAERGSRAATSISLRIEDLMSWSDEARSRGLRFTAAPSDTGSGPSAESADPDGFEVLLHEPAVSEFESEADDDVPHQLGMRKPVKKSSKAAARGGLRPRRRSPPPAMRRRPSATTQRVASVRGAGPERARLKPRRTGDERKAKSKPAIGRLKKAERKVMNRKREAVAQASKGRPVKHAAARSTRRP